MNKHQEIMSGQIMRQVAVRPDYTGYAARVMSAMIRAAMSEKSRRELIARASLVPAVIAHPDFII
jgi:hypothetical protein